MSGGPPVGPLASSGRSAVPPHPTCEHNRNCGNETLLQILPRISASVDKSVDTLTYDGCDVTVAVCDAGTAAQARGHRTSSSSSAVALSPVAAQMRPSISFALSELTCTSRTAMISWQSRDHCRPQNTRASCNWQYNCMRAHRQIERGNTTGCFELNLEARHP